MTEAVVLYITVADREEGLRIGRALVAENLVACANVFDAITSVFRWDGEVQEGPEALLVAKTRRELIDAATDLVRLEHSYDCPCVVAMPIVGGNPEFISWIGAETAGENV